MRYITPLDLWRTGFAIWAATLQTQIAWGARMMGQAQPGLCVPRPKTPEPSAAVAKKPAGRTRAAAAS